MPNYRAYIVGNDGHFNSSEDFIAHDDDNAIRIAQKLVDGHDVEVWQSSSRIAVLRHTRRIAALLHEVEPSTFERIVRSPSLW